MKKYELIKQYPGSDHVGVVVSQKTLNGMYEGWEYNYYKRHVENNPEYWEEVIEKDYEILSYLKKGSTTCTTTKRRGGESHEEFWNIHSVKRLSDGEVFTVGDKIKVYQHGSTKTIDKISEENDRVSFKNGIWFVYDSGGCTIDHAIKQTQPIFLSHDGKDIFAGDEIWYVNKESLDFDHFTTHANVTFRSDINAYFLTQEEAKDYIERNKPRLSIEDCFKILQKSFLYGNGFEKEIEKYVTKNNK